MAQRVVLRLSLTALVVGVVFPLATSNAQGSDSWLVSESQARGDADLKLDMAAAKRALGGEASADVQKRLIKAIREMLRSYPGKNRLFDSADAPPGAVDVTVPFLDLVQVERTAPAQAAAQPTPATAPVIPVQIGSTVAGLPGAIWADHNNDGRVDGFVLRGQYYAGQPAASLSASSAGGAAPGASYDAAAAAATAAAEARRRERRRQRQAEMDREEAESRARSNAVLMGVMSQMQSSSPPSFGQQATQPSGSGWKRAAQGALQGMQAAVEQQYRQTVDRICADPSNQADGTCATSRLQYEMATSQGRFSAPQYVSPLPSTASNAPQMSEAKPTDDCSTEQMKTGLSRTGHVCSNRKIAFAKGYPQPGASCDFYGPGHYGRVSTALGPDVAGMRRNFESHVQANTAKGSTYTLDLEQDGARRTEVMHQACLRSIELGGAEVPVPQ